jgi:MHS family citrate/tricarballylate:H+ symporter-like MFS transporter
LSGAALSVDQAGASPIKARHVAAAVVGNALEFYDFTTFALFATQVGRAFFPSHDPFISLMSSLATFWLGFVGRPVGAVVLGRIADRVGRKPALLLSFSLMGGGLVALALIPPYAKIGIAAPILAVACRLVQGFALGGEVGPTMAYLIEAAPAGKRGLYGSWQSASQSIAALAGAFVGVVLSSVLTPHQFDDWGWRAAFLIGALVLPFGLIVRSTLPETLHHQEAAIEAHPDRPGLASHARILILGVAMIMSFTTSTYVMSYMTTYALHTLHMAANVAFGASIVNGAVGVVFTLLGGWLSDRYGRKWIMLAPRVLFLLVTLPGFYLIVRNHDAVTLLVATGVIAAFSSLSTGAALISLTEGIRKEVRGLAVGAIYAIAVTIFGGATQFIITGLIQVTGNQMAPGYYMAATSLIGIVAMALMRETAGRPKA